LTLKFNLRKWLQQFFSADYTISKRLLGGVMVLVGGIVAGGMVALDSIRGGDFGPSQQLAFLAGMALFIIGLTLLPLGDTPA
jgi:hypothetical protein